MLSELVSKLSSDDTVGVICVVLCFIAGMTVWLTLQWRLHQRTEMEAALKQDMLSRGMSAADIERVLKAGLGTCGSQRVNHVRQPSGQTESVA